MDVIRKTELTEDEDKMVRAFAEMYGMTPDEVFDFGVKGTLARRLKKPTGNAQIRPIPPRDKQ